MTRSGVVVVGSANMDVVLTVDRVPIPGETLLATSSARYAGGKGLNQAVAAARAGAATTFIGALGGDDSGDFLARVVAEEGLRDDLVRRAGDASGQAFIVVDGDGENLIVVASGANSSMTELTGGDAAAIAGASVLLMQLELPLPVVAAAARVAREAGTTVMLNAAPAAHVPDEMLEVLDFLIVNEYEARIVAGSDELDEACRTLATRVDCVIVTLGAAGAAIYGSGVELVRIPARRVDVVDTTGAGDTFCGALAAAVARGDDVGTAARFATAAASLSVQATGAVPSIPTLDRIVDAL